MAEVDYELRITLKTIKNKTILKCVDDYYKCTIKRKPYKSKKMKKAIFIISMMLTTAFCTSIMAQTITSVNSAILPKRECEVFFKITSISITGNNSKTYMLVGRGYKFSTYKFTFKKTDGNAKATFTVFIDGIQNREWEFEGTIPTGEKTITLNNILGKEVTLKVKNHSATNKIEGSCYSYVNTNSMLFGGGNTLISNETHIKNITDDYDVTLQVPCNAKGTIEITRLDGTSGAEIVVTQGSTVIRTVTMSSTDPLKRIILNNLANNNNNFLKLTIRNIETNKFIKAKIGAWFN